MPYAAVLDANVLHPIMTTQVLLRVADRGLFRPFATVMREELEAR
jgi:hypothetical protein